MSETLRNCELPKSQCWSHANGELEGRGNNRRINYPKVPVLRAKLVSDQAKEPKRNDTVNRKSQTTVMTNPKPKLKLVFQAPLDHRRPAIAGQFDDANEGNNNLLHSSGSVLEKYKDLSMTGENRTEEKGAEKRRPVIAGQFDDANEGNNNLLHRSGSVLEKNEDLSMTGENRTEEKGAETFINNTTPDVSIEALLKTVGQTLSETAQFYPVKRLGDLCRGLLGSRLVCLLNSDDGGSLLVGVDEDHSAPGLRLTRGERDKVRQLLDSVCHDNIDPAVRAKHVDIEFIPVITIKDTFVIKITVIMSEILKMCNFKLKGLKAKGYEDGIYKLSGHNQNDSVCESAYFST